MQNLARIIHGYEEKFQNGKLDVEDLKLIENELHRDQKPFGRYFAVHLNLDAVNILRDELLSLIELLNKEEF